MEAEIATMVKMKITIPPAEEIEDGDADAEDEDADSAEVELLQLSVLQ